MCGYSSMGISQTCTFVAFKCTSLNAAMAIELHTDTVISRKSESCTDCNVPRTVLYCSVMKYNVVPLQL